MSDRNKRVCPVEISGSLDNKIRRWLQNPHKILRPFIKEGMTVLDIGCGPGVYAIEMAKLVGSIGRVFACDLQVGMLEKVQERIKETELADRITLCKSEEDDIGIHETVDFVLAFYVVHEVSDQDRFFAQISEISKPNGHILVVEPPLHVSKAEFEETIRKAQVAGFTPIARPRVFLSKAMLLKKEQEEPVGAALVDSHA